MALEAKHFVSQMEHFILGLFAGSQRHGAIGQAGDDVGMGFQNAHRVGRAPQPFQPLPLRREPDFGQAEVPSQRVHPDFAPERLGDHLMPQANPQQGNATAVNFPRRIQQPQQPVIPVGGGGHLEQPLPADGDAALADYVSPVLLGADESVGADTDLRDLAKRYQIANIKLDKTGGLTHAIDMQHQADQLGLEVMIGCMVATSWSMAPALLLAQTARFVDLDGPLLLERDRQPGLLFTDGEVAFPNGSCWGSG